MNLTYDQAAVRELANRPDPTRSTSTVTELVLGAGETAWNPASTKGPLYGPSTVIYDMHVSGISIYELNPGTCAAPIAPDTCTNEALPGTTRCADHPQAQS